MLRVFLLFCLGLCLSVVLSERSSAAAGTINTDDPQAVAPKQATGEFVTTSRALSSQCVDFVPEESGGEFKGIGTKADDRRKGRPAKEEGVLE